MLTLLLASLLALAPQQRPADPARDAWAALQRGDAEKAAAAFRAVLASTPSDPRALTGAGIAEHLLGHDEQAVDLLTRAIRADARFVQASYVLGPIAYAEGDLDLAIASYERVLKYAPDNPAVAEQLERWRSEAALHSTLTRQPTARFDVLFEGETQQDIANRVSQILEAAYLQVGKALNAYPPQTVTAILYTGEQFRDITQSPDWAAAAYDGRIRVPVRGALKDPAELERVLTHEFVHAVVHQIYRGIPKWLNEGLATYLEPGDHAWLMGRLRTRPPLIPLARLSDAFRTASGADAAIAYAQSYIGTRLLAERLGGNLPVFLQYLSEGVAFDEALLMFNVSPEDIQAEWARRAGAPRGVPEEAAPIRFVP
jgi:tetratricopeptide (TPR) repeat protein